MVCAMRGAIIENTWVKLRTEYCKDLEKNISINGLMVSSFHSNWSLRVSNYFKINNKLTDSVGKYRRAI